MRQRSLRQPKKNPQFSGFLGIVTGDEEVVEIAGRPGFYWVRLRNVGNEVIQAFNDRVSPIYNLPVLVERDLASPVRYKIVNRDVDIYGSNWGTGSPYVARHGSQHSFNKHNTDTGGDVTWVYSDQFLPFLITPSGSSGAGNVLFWPYVYHDNDGKYYCAGDTGTASLLGNLPTGSNKARMSLIYLDVSSGNPVILAGTEEFDNAITGSCQVLQYIPAVPNNEDIALAGVRLVSGTSAIGWWNLYDIRELVHKHPIGPQFGSMYVPGVDIVVSITGTGPIEVKDATDDGWAGGELDGLTFPTGGDEHYLAITEPGKYEILWNMSFHTDIGGAQEVHGGVMMDGVATRNNGEAHRKVSNANDSGDMGAPCIADFPNGNEEISLWISNDQSNDIHVEHSTVTVKLLGST